MSTKYTGSTGQVEVPDNTLVEGIKSWTIDVTSEVAETTAYEDAGVRSYLGTVFGWSGSFEGYKTGIPIVIDGSTSSINLREYVTGDVGWVGDCIITGVSASSTHDGIISYAYTFQGTGALTEPSA